MVRTRLVKLAPTGVNVVYDGSKPGSFDSKIINYKWIFSYSTKSHREIRGGILLIALERIIKSVMVKNPRKDICAEVEYRFEKFGYCMVSVYQRIRA